MTIQLAAEINIWIIFGLSWIFVIEHTVLSILEHRPWWQSIPGWIFAVAVLSLAVTFTFVGSLMVWPWLATQPWYLWSYVISFDLIAAGVAGKIVLRAWLFAHREK